MLTSSSIHLPSQSPPRKEPPSFLGPLAPPPPSPHTSARAKTVSSVVEVTDAAGCPPQGHPRLVFAYRTSVLFGGSNPWTSILIGPSQSALSHSSCFLSLHAPVFGYMTLLPQPTPTLSLPHHLPALPKTAWRISEKCKSVIYRHCNAAWNTTTQPQWNAVLSIDCSCFWSLLGIS